MGSFKKSPGEELKEDNGVSNDACDVEEGQTSSLSLDSCFSLPSIQQIDIKNSNHIHFGNKIILNGAVHISQLVADQISRSVISEQSSSNTDHKVKNKEPRLSKPVVVSVVLTAIIIITAVGLYFGLNSYADEMVDFSESPDSSDNSTTGSTSGFSALKIRTRDGWLAQPPTMQISALRLPVPLVIIAHTATSECRTQARCVRVVRDIQMLHVEGNHWSDIGYNFLVGGEGYIYEGRGWNKQGAHTYGFNVKSIGIALIGTFSSVRPPDRQFEAVKVLINEGLRLGKITPNYKLVAHCNVSVTESPGVAVFREIETWPHFTMIPEDDNS